MGETCALFARVDILDAVSLILEWTVGSSVCLPTALLALVLVRGTGKGRQRHCADEDIRWICGGEIVERASAVVDVKRPLLWVRVVADTAAEATWATVRPKQRVDQCPVRLKTQRSRIGGILVVVDTIPGK